MTVKEFSTEFDTLLNAYSVNATYGSTDKIPLTEYEKSVLLTKAQTETIIELYNGKNTYGDSFERTEELRRYLSPLVRSEILTEYEGDSVEKLSKYSKFFKLKDDVLFLTYEAFIIESEDACLNDRVIEVVPVSQDDFHRTVDNPFRGVNNRRALRLDVGDNLVEIVSKYDGDYQIRYIRKPVPIILEDLDVQGLSIDGEDKATEKVEVHEALHDRILDRAVRMALISKGYTITK